MAVGRDLLAGVGEFWRRLGENPIVVHHLRRSRWLPGRQAAQLAAGLWLVSFGAGVCALWPVNMLLSSLGVLSILRLFALILVVLGAIVSSSTLLLPPVSSRVVSRVLRQEVRADRYRLMCISSLSNMDIVLGYLAVGLYQTRSLLAVLLGVSPAAAAGLAAMIGQFLSEDGTLSPDRIVIIMSVIWLPNVLVAALIICGCSLLGLAVGINVELYMQQRTSIRSIAGQVLVFLVMLVCIFACMAVPGIPIWVELFGFLQPPTNGFYLIGYIVALPLAVLPWPVIWLLLRMAASNVRRVAALEK